MAASCKSGVTEGLPDFGFVLFSHGWLWSMIFDSPAVRSISLWLL
nr:MAG TPA: hypothetical protein [Caudoviricetes sp.]DAY52360.1 MAG TPA: hypothetical protein [Caudoviricetes sp.]